MIVDLEGAAMTTTARMHRQLQERLSFPDYYGENLDAPRDCLQYIELPLTVRWHHFAVCQWQLGNYADRALQTFQEAQAERAGFIVEIV
jgi:ribonuclease inhibitor